MRISINLATRPFVELRPLFARLRLTMIVLAVLATGLVFALRAERIKAKAATAQMDALKAETNNYNQELARNRARMGEPQNKSVLNRSQFLNQLFASKSFSWTAVMMDLERVLPAGVQVTAIEPAVSKEGEVLIRLRVTGDRDKTVQLVRNLERSQRFVAPRLAGESMMTADKAKALGAPGFAAQTAMNVNQPVGNGVEFEIFAGYNPLPEVTGFRGQGLGVSKPAVSSGSVVHHDRKPVKP
jgi:type IV pilus assembly protein PilN